jgi:hypothetical protein
VIVAAITAGAASVVEAAGCASEAATTTAIFGDWFGWVGSNVLVGALAPLLVITVIHWARKAGRTNANVEYFDAYRGGALGFIALGWIAGAVAEVVKAVTSGQPRLWHVWMLMLLGVVAIVAALAAGVGTIPLVTTTAQQQPNPQAVAQQTSLIPTRHAPTPEDVFVCKCSAAVCVIAFLTAAGVHYATS